MQWIDDLPTPALLVDRARLERNLDRMQERADAQGARLRPHTKTHKSVSLARLQVERGARGLTVAKTGEAEVFAEAGFDDIRLAYTVVGRDKLGRLASLADRARISFCVDTVEGARAAAAAFSEAGKTADVLVEVDVGYGRCGVGWDDPASVSFLRFVAEEPGLSLRGILTHAGHAYNGPIMEGESKEDALRRVMREERDHMLDLASRASQAGVPGVEPGRFEISVGSTPSMRHFENAERSEFRVTEIRPGNYVYHDATQVAIGSATWDECALTVLATVVSRHRNADGSERVFLDAGKKVFTSDRTPGSGTFGTLLWNPRVMEPLPHARLDGLSEEHGWVSVPGGSTLAVGDRVRIVPAHACVAVNTQDQVFVVEGERVIEAWGVDARGKVG
jgi:D-serine deaminase-like pyridoxal phosphate-dependent protein